MILAVCVDDKLGMLFNKRRQSKDRELRKDLLSLTDQTLWVNEYTAKQFTEDEQMWLNIREDYLDDIGEDDLCFVENLPVDFNEEAELEEMANLVVKIVLDNDEYGEY